LHEFFQDINFTLLLLKVLYLSCILLYIALRVKSILWQIPHHKITTTQRDFLSSDQMLDGLEYNKIYTYAPIFEHTMTHSTIYDMTICVSLKWKPRSTNQIPDIDKWDVPCLQHPVTWFLSTSKYVKLCTYNTDHAQRCICSHARICSRLGDHWKRGCGACFSCKHPSLSALQWYSLAKQVPHLFPGDCWASSKSASAGGWDIARDLYRTYICVYYVCMYTCVHTIMML